MFYIIFEQFLYGAEQFFLACKRLKTEMARIVKEIFKIVGVVMVFSRVHYANIFHGHIFPFAKLKVQRKLKITITVLLRYQDNMVHIFIDISPLCMTLKVQSCKSNLVHCTMPSSSL